MKGYVATEKQTLDCMNEWAGKKERVPFKFVHHPAEFAQLLGEVSYLFLNICNPVSGVRAGLRCESVYYGEPTQIFCPEEKYHCLVFDQMSDSQGLFCQGFKAHIKDIDAIVLNRSGLYTIAMKNGVEVNIAAFDEDHQLIPGNELYTLYYEIGEGAKNKLA